MTAEHEGALRLPPQNLDAERSVLGSILRDNATLDDVVQIVRAPSFYTDAHQKIFDACCKMREKGDPIDAVTLAEYLRAEKHLEDIGGIPYVYQLWDAAPTAANAVYYARIVRDKALVRSLIHASTEILRDAYDQLAPPNEMLETAERKIFDIAQMGVSGQYVSLQAALDEAYRRIDIRVGRGPMAVSGVATGYVDLDEKTAGFQGSELIIVAARPAVGKCLAFDSEIVCGDGSVTTIENLYRRRQARLLTLHDDLRLGLTEPSAYVDDGVKPVYRVTTGLGRCIETTLAHPFLTLAGWKRLEELRPGDHVAVPRVLPVFGKETLRECEVKLLGYFLGDGGLTDSTPEFTNSNPRLRDDFTAAVADFGAVKVRAENLDGPRTPALLVAGDPAFIATHRAEFASRNSKNPLTLWLDGLGLWGKDAHEKFIPAVVFRLVKSQVALLLNRLFATDGWATVLTGGAGQLGYSSVSERLARQIQHLLLRFGIIASLRRRAVQYKGQRRGAWQLDITDQRAIRAFIAEIGIFGKEDALARVERSLEGKKYGPNRDVIPVGVWERPAEAKGLESWCSLARRAGLGGHTNIHVGRRGLTRDRLARLAETLGDTRLRGLASSDVYWDRIRSIEPMGMKQVYDLTIPETHNFVANDVCVHNTAFALNLVRNMCVQEAKCVFFVSLEMSRIELAERLLCSQGKVDSHRLRKGHLNADDMQKLIEASDQLSQAKLFIDDSPAQGMLRIAANARRLKMRHGLDIVFIDYLQLIEPENKRDSRQEQVGAISRRLKFLAKELEIPVIALAQVNRSSEDRQDHKPRLSDLRESGSIEQDADTVMLLHRPEAEPGQRGETIDVIIAKQRNGPTDTITLTFVKPFMRFENFAVEAPFSYGS